MNRPVAADDDKQFRAILDRPARQVSELAGPLGEQRVARDAGGSSGPGDLRPTAPRRAVRRRRVDEEDGLNAFRRR
jgi:hypothetical protein